MLFILFILRWIEDKDNKEEEEDDENVPMLLSLDAD